VYAIIIIVIILIQIYLNPVSGHTHTHTHTYTHTYTYIYRHPQDVVVLCVFIIIIIVLSVVVVVILFYALIIVSRESRVLIAYRWYVPLQTGYVFTLHELKYDSCIHNITLINTRVHIIMYIRVYIIYATDYHNNNYRKKFLLFFKVFFVCRNGRFQGIYLHNILIHLIGNARMEVLRSGALKFKSAAHNNMCY